MLKILFLVNECRLNFFANTQWHRRKRVTKITFLFCCPRKLLQRRASLLTSASSTMATTSPPGSIELICGSMWASKSSTALARVRRYRAAKLRCVILRYAKDSRYHESKFSTHDKVMADAVSVSTLNDLPDSFFNDFDVILVDEAQFLHPLVEFSDKHANAGRTVIVAALDSDANRKPFGEVCDLMSICEKVTKLSAVCMVCYCRDAPFTKRLVKSDAVELIGGADKYEARCRQCWDAPIPNIDQESSSKDSVSITSASEIPTTIDAEQATTTAIQAKVAFTRQDSEMSTDSSTSSCSNDLSASETEQLEISVSDQAFV